MSLDPEWPYWTVVPSNWSRETSLRCMNFYWTASPSLLRQRGGLLGGYGPEGRQLREAMSTEVVASAFCEQYFVCWLVSSSGQMKLLSLKRSQQRGSTDLTEH